MIITGTVNAGSWTRLVAAGAWLALEVPRLCLCRAGIERLALPGIGEGHAWCLAAGLVVTGSVLAVAWRRAGAKPDGLAACLVGVMLLVTGLEVANLSSSGAEHRAPVAAAAAAVEMLREEVEIATSAAEAVQSRVFALQSDRGWERDGNPDNDRELPEALLVLGQREIVRDKARTALRSAVEELAKARERVHPVAHLPVWGIVAGLLVLQCLAAVLAGVAHGNGDGAPPASAVLPSGPVAELPALPLRRERVSSGRKGRADVPLITQIFG